MNVKRKIELGSLKKTLLLPLWGRAIETQKKNPILIDERAVSIIKDISYDFSKISKNISKISQASWIARAVYFDRKIKEFIYTHQDAVIVNIGCGLDTTFDRVDNGSLLWIDLDLPDVIALRREYISETDRRLFVAKSVFDTSWYTLIGKRNELMILMAGLVYYFEESEIKKLFNDFHKNIPGAEIIFDYCSELGKKIANKKVIDSGGMDQSAYLKWGIGNIYGVEEWNRNTKVICNKSMFRDHKKKYTFFKRAGMTFSDMLGIMSLAHIRIE